MSVNEASRIVLALDTSNEAIAIGVGKADVHNRKIEVLFSASIPARRQSNTTLLPEIDAAFRELGIDRERVSCVIVGRGPGSFTGVRIAMASAKGIALGLGAPLVGISTQNAIAEGVRLAGRKGRLLVASDAMRKEIYPSFFKIDSQIHRLTSDKVISIKGFIEEADHDSALLIAGDALAKYFEQLSTLGSVLPEDLWRPTGEGLLAEAERIWRDEDIDIFDKAAHDPIAALPIYTRLSDAEESERERLAEPGERNLITGVQGNKATGVITEKIAPEGAYAADSVSYRPFDVRFSSDAACMEKACMGTDAWTESMISDDISHGDRTWWMAVRNGDLVGYAGVRVSGDTAELLKIAVDPGSRRQGIASGLLEKVCEDAFNLAAVKMILEVRKSNERALAFYASKGFRETASRKKYYTDGEDALVLEASLPLEVSIDMAGDEPSALHSARAEKAAHPLILAVESSCDETACSIVDGNGQILSNIVSSQIDFHARFGGVVPEIASRKHVEAIVGVARLALDQANSELCEEIGFKDLDAIAVTYAPGLVGALVVGVAFAKGLAWACDKPIIAVNHLEGHLYANRFVCDDADGRLRISDLEMELPAVVSLVSGGNTMLVEMTDWHKYKILGETIDDAVGEAFDKVAKAMGFPYPGGPQISRLAKEGDKDAIDFPRALMHSGDYNFSLSGLKTAVISYMSKVREAGEKLDLEDICASFQQAVIDVQVSKAKRAMLECGAKTFCLGGGVGANEELRQAYEKACAECGAKALMAPRAVCGDNAAMIALVALDRYKQEKFASLDQDAFASADLEKPY